MIALIAGVTVLRLLYVASGLTELYADEAYYWVWSRRLDWSYYSKGPMVAYLIHLSTLAGQDTAFFVRLPAVLLGAVTMTYLGRMGRALFGDWRTGFFAAFLGAAVPILNTLSTVLTIDGPLLCFWIVSAFHLWRSIGGETRGWDAAAAGLALGLGLMAKAVMIFVVPSYLIFLAMHPRGRAELRSFRPWGAIALGLLFLVPQIYWNAKHEWVMFRDFADKGNTSEPFQLGHEHVVGLVGSQLIVLSPLILAALIWSMVEAVRRARRGDVAARFMLCFSLPVMGFYVALSLHTHVNSNWMLAGYLAPLVGLAGYGLERWDGARGGARRLVGFSAASAVGLALAMGFGPLLFPLVYRFGDAESFQQYDPTVRVAGWKAMAERADYWRRKLKRDEEPFLFGSNYAVPSLLRFYGDGHPEAVSLETDPFENQFYFIDDLESLRGRNGILVSTRPRESYIRDLERAFASVKELEVYAVMRGSTELRRVYFYHARNFKGWTYGVERSKK